MKNKAKIAMCIFIFVIGTAINVVWTNLFNAALSGISTAEVFANSEQFISNITADEKLSRIFWIFEGFVILLCICYFAFSHRPYEAKTYKVTDEITIPMPYGQGQHGTAWFMSDKEKTNVFDYITLSRLNPLVAELLKRGKERHNAIEQGNAVARQKQPILSRLADQGGIVVAREEKNGSEHLPIITSDVHSLTIGATRCGKTRCLVLQSICTLALAGEGMVINDPKGELYHYTHGYLEDLGYTVRVVDFQSPKKSDRYNPFQMIIDAINDDRIDDAQTYACDLVTFIVEKNEHSEPIWTNGEMAVVAAAILCVVYDNQDHPEYQNLTNVYHFIANMCKNNPQTKTMPIDDYMRKLDYSHPARALISIAKIAPDRMGGSFYTSALTTLRLFVTNDMYLITHTSEFSLSDFGTKERQALFFILPDQKATYYPIVTLIVSQQYEQLVSYAKRHGNRLPNRVNFILDEFGNFSKINDFQVKLTVAGGYGIRWNMFIQDFNQLVDKYGQEVAGIIRGNCHYWIYLHSQDNNTNEEISKRMGQYTTSTYSLGGTIQAYSSPSSSTNVQLSQRNLLNADEVSRIKRPNQLILSEYSPAVMTAPDISKWLFNEMLGMGDMKHNIKLIDIDENNRPERGGKTTQQKIWKPWEQQAVPDGVHRKSSLFIGKGGRTV